MKLKIDVLCSTMYGKVPLIFIRGTKPDDVIVINQCIEGANENKDFLNYYEKGLSKSRNAAIFNAKAEICLIADNDVYYGDETFEKVRNAFLKYPEADILTFKIETPDGEPFKSYRENFFWHNKHSVAKVSSIEIAFRRKSIVQNRILFDENFGLGSRFATGEEYIFLRDALKKGLKAAFVPEVIVYHPKESSGGQFNNIELIEAKGAMIRRVFGISGYLVCMIFCLKKFRYSQYGFLTFLKTILKGFRLVKNYD